jgi:hypothetical protein
LQAHSLLAALLAVQQEVPTLPKDAINPHFRSRYTPLDTIVEHVGPILTKNGLVWLTMPCRDEHGDPALQYRLAHASTGEVLEGTMPLLLTKADPQGMGSAITYARRYSLCAVLNLVADEDDDGNAGSAMTTRSTGCISGSRNCSLWTPVSGPCGCMRRAQISSSLATTFTLIRRRGSHERDPVNDGARSREPSPARPCRSQTVHQEPPYQ